LKRGGKVYTKIIPDGKRPVSPPYLKVPISAKVSA
jgi:hypothetical protein